MMKNSFMAFAGTEDNHFYGHSDTWAPSKLCLREILKKESGFKPIQEENWSITRQSHFIFCGKKTPLARITMIATPIHTLKNVQQWTNIKFLALSEFIGKNVYNLYL